MEYGYKITSNGQTAVMAALDLGRPLKITRAAIGSGTVEEGTDLTGVHALKAYAAEAAIVGRRHEENRMFLTVQYSNQDCQEAFTIGEFMVYAADPETGRETDFLYATLGDFRQPVPPYTRGVPSGVWEFPLIVAASEQLRLEITASPGLITDNDPRDAIDRLKLELFTNTLTLPLTADSGEALLTSSGTPLLAVYHPDRSAAVLAELAALAGRLSGHIAETAKSLSANCATASMRDQAYADGRVLALEQVVDKKIQTEKAEAITATVTVACENAAAQIAAHNSDTGAHPAFLHLAENTILPDPEPPVPIP